jgi:hypothetical protein
MKKINWNLTFPIVRKHDLYEMFPSLYVIHKLLPRLNTKNFPELNGSSCQSKIWADGTADSSFSCTTCDSEKQKWVSASSNHVKNFSSINVILFPLLSNTNDRHSRGRTETMDRWEGSVDFSAGYSSACCLHEEGW